MYEVDEINKAAVVGAADGYGGKGVGLRYDRSATDRSSLMRSKLPTELMKIACGSDCDGTLEHIR